MVFITKKLIDQSCKVIIAEDINESGAKQFVGLKTELQIFPYVKSQEKKCFHELMPGLENRKLYFDADKKVGEGEFPDIYDFMTDMKLVLVVAVKALFGVVLDENDICFTNSSVDNKFSSHVIVPSLNTSVANMRILYNVVSGALNKQSELYKINERSILDPNVYKSNQTLRLLHCNKMGKHNTKQLLTSCFTETDTLVGYLHDSTTIYIKPEIQRILDERNEKRDAERLGRVSKSPEIFRKIVMGLAQDRADDFRDWQRVCMALGYECAGVAIALEFSRRSNKFNEVSTIRLYESGSNYTGRPLTIGTLLGMLKKDNIVEFYNVIGNQETTDVSDDIKTMIDSLDSDDDDDVVVVNTPEPKPEKQEEKLERWLKNPSFFFNECVSDGKNTLERCDKLIQYNQRFMKEYPSIYDTYFIKAQKGQGKTVALEKYISEHNPKRIVVVSFRRSFSNEIIKRFSKLGFVNYRDIEGAITNDRVIIQVESLHRLKWTERCDLMVLDEIESIRSQFFSPTCKFRNSVIEKYDMLLRTSKQVFALDADISENTVKHLKSARLECKTCYIENTHQEVQADFKEFYTTKVEKIIPKICQALDAGQKIVIPTNRSVEFMAGLKQELEEKYPDAKVQMYNSKNKGGDELQDVAKSWIKYDVVIYSPTISAGVSFDELHFDKCFCIFTNNGKINSMRQMISRVRNFASKEYYYCLQSFGGSSKPDTIVAFERYICSNRYLFKPEFIMSRQSWNGTREYPYKDVGYWMWVYNETEKARDKNMFLYNFLREQYHSGVGKMNWLDDETGETKINETDLIEAKKEIHMNEIEQIATADAINDTVKVDIEQRLEDEKEISAGEMYSLQRRRLLDCYDLSERRIHPIFVEHFNKPGMKSAYHNRKALARGIDVLMEEESNQFNGVFTDSTSVQDDLNKNYKSMKIVIAKELLEIAGFSGFYDDSVVSKNDMLASFKSKESILIEKMPAMCDVLGKSKRRRPDIAKWTEANYLKNMMAFVNSIITDLFQLKIKQTGQRTGLYKIDGINQFDFRENSIWFSFREDSDVD